MNNGEFQAHTERIERLVEKVNTLADEHARAAALDLMQSLMDLHGAAVSRIIELLSGAGEAGQKLLAKLGEDPLICGLLVLYGAHPVPLEERVRQAIERVRPQLTKRGALPELVCVDENVVRIKVEISGHDHHGADALRTTLEQAIREAAPEVSGIVFEGLLPSAFVPLSMIQPAFDIEEKPYEKSAA